MLFIHLLLAVRFFVAAGFSLVAASRGYPLVAVQRLLSAAASLVAEHGLGHMGLVVAATGL